MVPSFDTAAETETPAAYDEGRLQSRPEPGKCDWTATRNLPTDDVELAANLIDHEAQYANEVHGRKVRDYLFRGSLNAAPGEHFSKEQWLEMVDYFSNHEALQLGEHSAWIAHHTDRPHDHVHVSFSRITPDGKKVWRDSQYKRRVRAACTDMEKKYGLRVVTHDRERDLEMAATREENMMARRTGQPARDKFSDPDRKRIAKATRQHFFEAKSWDDLQGRLAGTAGIEVQAKGPGLVLTDGRLEMKLSDVARNIRRARSDRELKRDTSRDIYLEEQFGQKWEEYSGEPLKVTRKDKRQAAQAQSRKKTKPRKQAREPQPEAKQKTKSSAAEITKRPQKTPKRPSKQASSGGQAVESKKPVQEPKPKAKPTRRPIQHEKPVETAAPAEWLPDKEMEPEDIKAWRDAIGHGIRHAGSWRDLDSLAHFHGLNLVGGYAMHDGGSHFRLSQIDKRITARALTKKFGPWSEYKRPRTASDKQKALIERMERARNRDDREMER